MTSFLYRAIALALILLSLYSLACLALWRFQTQFMFFPNPQLQATPADRQLSYEDVWLPVEGGQVHGWWIPAPSDTMSGNTPVLLYLHGNGSNLGDLVSRAYQFHRWGYRLLLIDYRGYGNSSGPFPNEARVYADAAAGWRHLDQRQIPASQRIIYGRSIGGAIALQLARQYPEAAGLILESTFTSMAEMVTRSWLNTLFPLQLILTQRFDSLSKIPTLQMPVLLLHGTSDTVIPAHMSQVLHDAAPEPKTLVWIEGADHNNLTEIGGDHYRMAVQGFISQVLHD